MVEIRVEGVTREYGETTALEDVTFTAEDGEFFTLVGPSGCGKTTTLRTIAGFETPDSGRVRFGDRDVTGLAPEQRDVGIVFQSYALFPHMSVAGNVGYGLRFRDPPGGVSTDERVAELLELVDLAGMGDRDPAGLSGGQRQRVALARALAPGPGVLLLDEPMSALDARLRESLRRQVREIQTDLGITTVYVTHDQEEAMAISDRVAVMSDGRIEQTGTPRDVYRQPATRFVAEFLGENNVFDGRVTETGTGTGTGTGTETGDRLAVTVDDHEFELAAPADPPGEGEPVAFCVRPEALEVGADHNRISADVLDWEFLGATVRVHCEWAGRRLTVRTDDVPDADELAVGFDPAAANVID